MKFWSWKINEGQNSSNIECVLTVPSAHSWAPSCFESWNGYLGILHYNFNRESEWRMGFCY